MTERSSRTAVILAGGQSRRFGSDKLRAPFRGTTLLDYTIRSLQAHHDHIVIAGPRPKFAMFGFPVIEDDHPFSGPLVALCTIWKKIPADSIFLAAGDMPLPHPHAMEDLWASSHAHDISLLEGKGGPSPLPGVYTRQTQPIIESIVREGNTRLKDLFDTPLSLSLISRSQLHAYDPNEWSLWNVNFPTDLIPS